MAWCLVPRFRLALVLSQQKAIQPSSHRLCHLGWCPFVLFQSGLTAACTTIHAQRQASRSREELFSGSSAVTFGERNDDSSPLARLLVMEMANSFGPGQQDANPASPVIVSISKFHNHGSSGSTKWHGVVSGIDYCCYLCHRAVLHIRTYLYVSACNALHDGAGPHRSRCHTSSSGYSAVV